MQAHINCIVHLTSVEMRSWLCRELWT